MLISDEELLQILKIQERNLAAGLTSEEKKTHGFLTVQHTFDVLKKMNNRCPHIIAKYNNEVVGYALCMHPTFENEIEVLKPMFDEINSIPNINRNYIVMGQICIDEKYRGQGIFRKLYKTMKKEVFPEFSSIITEADALNKRSLEAHYAVGFQKIKVYEAGGQTWKLIQLK